MRHVVFVWTNKSLHPYHAACSSTAEINYIAYPLNQIHLLEYLVQPRDDHAPRLLIVGPQH